MINVAFAALPIRKVERTTDVKDATTFASDVYVRLADPTEANGGTGVLVKRLKRLKAEAGFTTVTLMGVLMVGGLLVMAASRRSTPTSGSRATTSTPSRPTPRRSRGCSGT